MLPLFMYLHLNKKILPRMRLNELDIINRNDNFNLRILFQQEYNRLKIEIRKCMGNKQKNELKAIKSFNGQNSSKLNYA